jgi:hypothetical protein
MNEEAKQQVIDAFEDVTGPDDMSKEEFVEFTEDLISDLQTRLDATREELGK